MTARGRTTISVCIANYNGGDLVLECLASVQAQRVDAEVEVIVHDDASTDDSLRRIVETFPSARTIPSSENVGFCISNNRMAEAASGHYLLLLNNDAVLRPGSLDALLAFAHTGHGDSILGLPQYAMGNGELVDIGYLTDPFLNPIPIVGAGPREVGVATGACLWVPRGTWDAVGGFPTFFESVAEDIHLCLAARRLGFRVFVLEGPGFDHVIGQHLGGGKLAGDGLRTTARRRRLSERNKTCAMLVCYPRLLLLAILPLHVLLLGAEACFLLLTGTPPDKIGRIYGALPAELWERRHDIWQLRRRLVAQAPPTAGFFRFTRWWPQKLAMLLRHGRPTIG